MFANKLNQPGRILRVKNETQHVSAVNEESVNSIYVKEVNGKIPKIVWICLFTIIVCVNHFFSLVPWAKIQGSFNTSDIGLLILVMLLTYLLVTRKSKARLNNGVSYVILLYLLMVFGQVANVSINFGQSIFDGLVAIRHQLYYLSFFVFLMLLEDERCMKQVLNFILFLGAVLSVIGMINYFGLTLYYHEWAEGHGERAGITRAFFAGMPLIAFSMFWIISQWLVIYKTNLPRALAGVLLISALVMRQTRGIIIGVVVTVVIMLIHKRKMKMLFIVGVFAVLLSVIISVYKGTNIIVDPFISAYEDVTEGGGTWEPRLKQLEDSVSIFMKYPVFGGGTYAIRLNKDGKSSLLLRELSEAHANADLGYIHWLRSYGIVGVVWLLALYIVMGKYIKRIAKIQDKKMEPIVLLSSGYMIYVVFTFITYPHFIRADTILLVCLALALMVRVRQLTYQT